ncbi:MAG: glycosyltransferase family 4 protein [Thermodesulfobacteriota bacterium]|nr:glycosyltransferase family 4 protein [Thermodesulfobacteriota bacterium]
MKVAVVTNILSPYRISYFEELNKQVEELTIVLMARSHKGRDWELGQYGFRTIYLNGFHVKPKNHPISLHYINYGVIRCLKTINPDIVVNGGFGATNILTFIYCKLFKKKYIGWGELSYFDNALSSYLKKSIRRIMSTRSDGTIASSIKSKECFEFYGADPSKILVTTMPVDIRSISRLAEQYRLDSDYSALKNKFGTPVLISVGRLSKEKGLDHLINIFEKVKASLPDAALLIVGDGPLRSHLETTVQKKNLSQVHFPGFLQTEKLIQYLVISDLFLFTTMRDPFGAVLSEAMACRVPVIASHHAYASWDLIEDTQTGYLIDPTDYDASHGKIMECLSRTKESKKRMTQLAYDKVYPSNCENTAKKTAEFLHQILNTGQKK